MSKDISTVIDYLIENISETDIILYASASEELIEQFEKTTQIQLPDDIKEFYKFSNGFDTSGDKAWLFRMIPLDDILEGNDYSEGKFTVAEYMIFSDIWEVEINPNDKNLYEITNNNYGTDDGKISLTESFEYFLYKFLKGGLFEKDGLYDWYEEIKLNKK